jgi:hypothetical protein
MCHSLTGERLRIWENVEEQESLHEEGRGFTTNSKRMLHYVRFEVFTAVTMKNVVFCDIKPQIVPHRRHVTSPLQSSAQLMLCKI